MEWERHQIFGIDAPAGDPDALLFRYSSLEQAAAVALRRDLLLAPLSAMNDPNEANREMIHPVTSSTNRSVMPHHVDDDERRPAQDVLNDRRRNTRIASFTRDAFDGDDGTALRADGRGYARQTMWSHYADGGAGVCLVYDRDELDVAAANKWHGRFVSRPITYEAGLSEAAFRRSLVDFDAADLDAHYHGVLIPNLFAKNADWAVEREHRLLIPDDPALDPSLWVGNAVKGLVLGPNFPSFKMPTAVAIAETFQVTHNAAHAYIDKGVIRLAPWRRNTDHTYGLYSFEEQWKSAWAAGRS